MVVHIIWLCIGALDLDWDTGVLGYDVRGNEEGRIDVEMWK